LNKNYKIDKLEPAVLELADNELLDSNPH